VFGKKKATAFPPQFKSHSNSTEKIALPGAEGGGRDEVIVQVDFSINQQ